MGARFPRCGFLGGGLSPRREAQVLVQLCLHTHTGSWQAERGQRVPFPDGRVTRSSLVRGHLPGQSLVQSGLGFANLLAAVCAQIETRSTLKVTGERGGSSGPQRGNGPQRSDK